MRLLLHDTLVTAPFTHPLAAGWIEPGVPLEVRAELRGGDLSAEHVALLPAAEVAAAQATHRVAPDAAVVAGVAGAVAMRTPARPDEIERGPVRLWRTSGTAELLARATLRPFYGIEPTGWVSGEDDPAAASAQVVVVEGAEALRPPEVGFGEDLCRAWFILTGVPAVGHVLLVPDGADRDVLGPALATLDALRVAAHERRRELRQAVATAHDLPFERLVPVLADQRLVLEEGDRRALLMLLQRGLQGSTYPPLEAVRFLDPNLDAPAG